MAWTNEVIRKGDKGDLVENVQKGLLFLGYKQVGNADGIYGRDTLSAIQDFQTKHGLDVDGICGPSTGKKLEDVYWAKVEADKKGAAKAPAKGMPTKGAPGKFPPKK